ncbi:hypothetical protein [Enterococcus rivorum]|uniref:Uncharacterized protein n=2 Tax=Enterococcus rivorum TaxID=762845 RepID=A0A1E5KU79_9ENTE|nr:hypothetical protein [Enterococcus rivorum]MBP2100603.1 hypothetical protein [Enterococcus rivorum]OEH81416.1 hypothetical protein BCR26_16555 [Enterococcus rivorum]
MKKKMLELLLEAYLATWFSLVLFHLWEWNKEITIKLDGSWIVIISLLVIVIIIKPYFKNKAN